VEDAATPDKPPTFTLPDWGTEGAPALPPEAQDEPPVQVVRAVDSVTDRPRGIRRQTTVVGSGEHPIGVVGLAEASRLAAVEAVADAEERARRAGNGAVVDVRIALTSDGEAVAALAYGSAVEPPAR
jgi:uncharacterized protein YbjQ (UPF0145 family)